MYACEMQICCYKNVEYFARIKFHVYHLATILWGIFFPIFSFSNKNVFYKFCCYIIEESIYMNSFVFQFIN
jgi:hypothetical protein